MSIKFPLSVFFFLFVAECIAQTGTIKGVVINNKTRERLPFAVVYINYTTIGVTANSSGEFILRNVPVGQQDLVATFVGHHPQRHKVIVKDSAEISITIGLESKELKEVKIQAKRDKNWDRQYEKFKRLFLGNSVHAARCEILNPWVLDFDWNDKGFFTARASDVLEIQNLSLGYKLYYQMINFKVGSKEYLIGGNVRFQPMDPGDSTTSNTWAKNRAEVYAGSSRHLFRSIVHRTLNEEGFELYKDDTGAANIIRMANFLSNIGKELSVYGIEDLHYVELRPNQFQIKFPERLEIHFLHKPDRPDIYRNVTHAVSWIETSKGTLMVKPDGVVLDPDHLFLSGNMSQARIAELLPYNFVPPPTRVYEKREKIQPAEPINALQYLLERPYLHTDKSYYYPNETVWFRGHMNYGAKSYRDSLSQALYVDLLDASQKVVLTKIFEINNGKAIGNFVVPPFLQAGDYVLRAYTRWMLNFDSSLVFVKPFKLLEYTEVAKSITPYTGGDTTSDVSIETDKSSYDTREKITVRIGVKDFIDNLVPAEYSVSVTDFKQVVFATSEKNITQDFPLPKIALPDSLAPETAHPIEHGIGFSGRFVSKKGKGEQGLIAVARENTAQMFTITTEENGNFAFSNLKLYDTAKLTVLAKTITGRVGKLIVDSIRYSPKVTVVTPLDVEVYRAENPSRYNVSNDSLIAHMLDEVVINESRIQERGSSTFGLADQVVTGAWLRSQNTQDVMMAMQSKVPGLRVVNGFIKLGNQNSFSSDQSSNEPLVLLDGVPVNAFSDGFSESTASIISNLSPHDIERIDVLKYSNSSAYGSRGANGVIVITTRKNTGNYERFGERGRFVELKVPGFSATKKFRAPDYSVANPSHKLSDYRSTLYWNPSLTTNSNNIAEFSFYAADLQTQYRIVVEGITEAGRVVHAEKLITVAANQ